MERKITKMGPSSLVVSLPSKWVKKHNLKKGDSIEAIEQHKKLLISLVGKKNEEFSLDVDVNEVEPFIERYMSILYKKGYDEMCFTVHNSKQQQRVIGYVSQLVGFEIVDQKENTITIRHIAKDSPQEFDVVVKRVFHTLLSFSEELLGALIIDDKDKLQSLLSYEVLNNKLTDYCKRLLFKYHPDEKSMMHYAIVRDLEMIGDELEFITLLYLKGNRFDKKLVPYFKSANSYLRNFYTIYYKKDVSLFPAFVDHKRKYVDEILLRFDKEKFPNTRVLQNLLNIVQRTFDLNVPLATLIE